MPEYKFKKTFVLIISWIFCDDNLDKLLEFDSKSFFQVLAKIFESEKIIKILRDDNSLNEIKEGKLEN